MQIAKAQRRLQDELNPVPVGAGVFAGTVLGALMVSQIVGAFSLTLLAFGINPSAMIFACAREGYAVLVPIANPSLAGWLIYSLLHLTAEAVFLERWVLHVVLSLLSIFVFAVTIHGLCSAAMAWASTNQTFLTLRDRIVKAWWGLIRLPTRAIIVSGPTDPSRSSSGMVPRHTVPPVGGRNPPHDRIGVSPTRVDLHASSSSDRESQDLFTPSRPSKKQAQLCQRQSPLVIPFGRPLPAILCDSILEIDSEILASFHRGQSRQIFGHR